MYLMLFYSSTEKLPIDKALFYFYSFCRSNRSINLNISCIKKLHQMSCNMLMLWIRLSSMIFIPPKDDSSLRRMYLFVLPKIFTYLNYICMLFMYVYAFMYFCFYVCILYGYTIALPYFLVNNFFIIFIYFF